MTVIEFKKRGETVNAVEYPDDPVEECYYWWLISYTYLDKDNNIGVGTMYYYNPEYVVSFHKYNQDALYEMVHKHLPEGFRKYIINAISYLGEGTKSDMVLTNEVIL